MTTHIEPLHPLSGPPLSGPLRAASAPPQVVAEESHDRAYGLWLYLMSDAVIFALLFATYAVMKNNTVGGPTAHDLYGMKRVAIETALLLASSFTFGLASLAGLKKDKSGVWLWLVVTGLLGAGFLFAEFSEFSEMIGKGAGPDRSGFLSSFFVLVGTHGLHVTIGMIWLIIMLVQLQTKGLTARVASRIQRLGIFWHFLDLIWVGIFSVVYLPGIMK